MVTHENATRNAIADAVVDRVDLGSTNASGKLRIYTANKVILLADLDLANPAFGDAAVGVASANSLPISDDFADGSGNAAVFDVLDRDENIVFSGTVGTSDADMLVADTEIADDDIVKIISFDYTAPP